jgi:hypothetical protein
MKFIFTCLTFVSLISFSIQTYAQDTLTLPYHFYDGDCGNEIVKLVKGPGIRLVFTTAADDMPLLIGISGKGAGLSKVVKFTKLKLDGWDAYTSRNDTQYSYKSSKFIMHQLWLEKKANQKKALITSAFYLGDKCLVSNVPMKIPS